ncbi:hypothetical protein JCM18918_1864 [Cutibacterium acnes JCM 18918]|nr:hypothetical protein JCM18918_1864 [Cutibacterium acnes JCM 18918]
MKKISRRHFLHASAGLAAAALTGCGSNTHSFSPGSNSSAMPGDSGKIVQWYHEYGGKGVQQAANHYANESSNEVEAAKNFAQ